LTTCYVFQEYPLADRVPKATDDPSPASPATPSHDSSAAALAAIDRQLVDLLQQRAELVRRQFIQDGSLELAGLMHAQGQQIDVLVDAQFATVSDGETSLAADAVAAWLRHAASLGLSRLHAARVAYLGPQYSYSHLAALKFFGDAAPMAAVATIPAVFDSIIRGDAQAGLVPIENSTDGRIVDTLGMFVRVNVKICGEVLLPIHHNLLSRTPREQIREVHSKPQALSQCRTWLANHLPQARLVECGSTTTAAELASTTVGVAAVASIEAARQYQLDVIDSSIEDNPNNVTRFAVLGRNWSPRSGNDTTAILFQVPHRPGVLADAMMLFKDAGLNLTWIESFPLPQTTAEYLFFVEVAGHVTDPAVASTLEKLGKLTLRLEVLGSYPKATPINA
jgi:chorismate mutase/prephenate dehydratase